MQKNLSQQCTRCVMDTTDPDIIFSENGECNHCIEFLEKRSLYKYRGETSDREFENWITEMKAAGKGKEFDCVVD